MAQLDALNPLPSTIAPNLTELGFRARETAMELANRHEIMAPSAPSYGRSLSNLEKLN